MAPARRWIVGTFTALLLGAWTVPLCCLSMGGVPSHVGASAVAPMASTAVAGHQHHHHGHSSSDQSSKRLTARESCAQNCQPAGRLVGVSVSLRHDWGVQGAIATLNSSLDEVVIASRLLNICSAGPPGITPAPSDRTLPLRI